MPWKDIEKQRLAIRKHYYANRQAYIDKSLRRRKEIRAWIRGLKEAKPCTDCNQYYPYYVMDFDHLENKEFEMNKLVNKGSYLRLRTEIAKCELVCSNCHRIRTHLRREASTL